MLAQRSCLRRKSGVGQRLRTNELIFYDRVNETIDGLKHGAGAKVNEKGTLCSTQHDAVRRLACIHRANSPARGILMPQEAATELLHVGSGYNEVTPTTVVAYNAGPDVLSLPNGQSDLVPMFDVLGAEGARVCN